MPPPKKPKQGVTRVDQFLSASELEELRNKTTSLSRNRDKSTKDSEEFPSTRCQLSPISAHTVTENDKSETIKVVNKPVEVEQESKPFPRNSDILQSLLKSSSAKDNSVHVEQLKIDVDNPELCQGSVSASSSSLNTSDEESCSSLSDSVQSSSGDIKNECENTHSARISRKQCVQVETEPNTDGFNGLIKSGDTNDNSHVLPYKRTETRRFDSLMMRRKLDSLMDVLRPTLPEDTRTMENDGHRDTRTSVTSSNEEFKHVNDRDIYRKVEHFRGYVRSECLEFHSKHTNGVITTSDRRGDGHNGMPFAKNERSSHSCLPILGLPSLDRVRPALSLDSDRQLHGIHKPYIANEENGYKNRPILSPPALGPLLSIPTFNSHAQSTNQLFLASHLHKNIFNRPSIQDPLARLQMSGRPAFKSFVRPVIANSCCPVVTSSGESKKLRSVETNLCTESSAGERSVSRPPKPINFHKNQEPVDIDYDIAIGTALQSVRASDNVISSSSEGGIKDGIHGISTHLSFDYGQPLSSDVQSGNQTTPEMPNNNLMRSISAPSGKISSPSEMPSSTMEDHLRRSMDDKGQVRRCQICNDNASGFHYGVWSCEGCKAFFKRSLQGPVDYVCPATNSCTIDKHRRKSCQACRLRKCVETGMSRGSCRKERRSSGARALKHKANDFPMDNCGVSPSKKPLSTDYMKTETITSLPNVGLTSSASAPVLPFSNTRPHNPGTYSASYSTAHQPNISRSMGAFSGHAGSQMAVISPFRTSTSNSDAMSMPAPGYSRNPGSSSPRSGSMHSVTARTSPMSQAAIHPLVEHLLRIDPPARQSGHDNTKDDNEMNIMSSILRLCDMELVDIINWAKSIPGYTELDLADRIHLLECCWMEILLIGLIWRSMDKSDVLYLSSDLQLDKERLKRANFSQIGTQILACVKQFERLELKHEEFVLLRCAILLNSDLGELHNIEKIESLKSRIMETLQYTVLERSHSNTNRMVQILMILPHTRQIAMQVIQHLLSQQMQNILPMYALLKEMVEAFVKVLGLDWSKRTHDVSASKQSSVTPADNKLQSPSR